MKQHRRRFLILDTLLLSGAIFLLSWGLVLWLEASIYSSYANWNAEDQIDGSRPLPSMPAVGAAPVTDASHQPSSHRR